MFEARGVEQRSELLKAKLAFGRDAGQFQIAALPDAGWKCAGFKAAQDQARKRDLGGNAASRVQADRLVWVRHDASAGVSRTVMLVRSVAPQAYL